MEPQAAHPRTRHTGIWIMTIIAPALLFAGLLMIFQPPSSAAGATALTVCPDTPGSFATIQEAINNAPPGAVVDICAGTYLAGADIAKMGSAIGGFTGDLTLRATGAVTIAPATGNALWSSGSFTGSLTLIDINATSPDNSAAYFGNGTITGTISVLGGSFFDSGGSGFDAILLAAGNVISGTSFTNNGGVGLSLVTYVGDADCAITDTVAISVIGSEAISNSIDGFYLLTKDGDIQIRDSQAISNGSSGFNVETEDYSALCGSDGDKVDVYTSRADYNGLQPPPTLALNGGLEAHGFEVAAPHANFFAATATGNAYDGVYDSLFVGEPNSLAPDTVVAPNATTFALDASSVTGNGRHGINAFNVDVVTTTQVSAIGNISAGLSIAFPVAQPQLMGIAAVDHTPPAVSSSLFMSNAVGINLTDAQVIYGLLGAAQAAADTNVIGNAICDNALAGIVSSGPFSHTLGAPANYWGAFSGPSHPDKNPTGTGNQVIDFSNPSGDPFANGDVVFAPWVDRSLMAVDPVVALTGAPRTVGFTFPAGVAAGLSGSLGNPFDVPLFTLSTNNGVLTTAFGSGASVPAALVNGSVAAVLVPSTPGMAMVTLSGPCGLASALQVPVVQPGLQVVKSVGLDPDACAAPSSEPVVVPAGSSVYFCVTVTNTGNITLTNHQVNDTLLGVSLNFPYPLGVGVSVPITRALFPSLGPIPVTAPITNSVAVTSSVTVSDVGGITFPAVTFATQATGTVRLALQPTDLAIAPEPDARPQLFIPFMKR